jgi:hypothetical protein
LLFLLVAVLLLGAAIGGWVLSQSHAGVSIAPAVTAPPAAPPVGAAALIAPLSNQHPIFPFSVIAGGAHSPAELRDAVSADPVVARHYAGFHLDRVRVIQLSAPRMAYVSYRRGNKIFWTRHKMALPAGETLLTDGANFARTRCGNRLAESPQTPVADDEPQQRAFDRPATDFPPARVDDPSTLGGTELTDLSLPPGPPFVAGPPTSLFPGTPTPPIFLPPIPGGPTPGGPGEPGPGPVSTPEPSALLLALCGALALFAIRKHAHLRRTA